MDIYTARRILIEAGEHWYSVFDLKMILRRTFDPTIKLACDRLITRYIH